MSEYDWGPDTILVRSWATSNHLNLLTFCVHAVNMGPLVHWTFATPLTWDLNPSTHLGNFFKQLFWFKRSNWPTYYLFELSIVQPEVINYFWLSRWPLIILTLVFFLMLVRNVRSSGSLQVCGTPALTFGLLENLYCLVGQLIRPPSKWWMVWSLKRSTEKLLIVMALHKCKYTTLDEKMT